MHNFNTDDVIEKYFLWSKRAFHDVTSLRACAVYFTLFCFV